MQSPVLDVDPEKFLGEKGGDSVLGKALKTALSEDPRDLSGRTAVVLASVKVYTDAAIQKIMDYMGTVLCLDAKERIGISLDFNADADAVQTVSAAPAQLVVLVHEVWQPPIRGLLHYITQVKAALPPGKGLVVLLTREAGQADLGVDEADVNYAVWKKAIFNLGNPDIAVKRMT